VYIQKEISEDVHYLCSDDPTPIKADCL